MSETAVRVDARVARAAAAHRRQHSRRAVRLLLVEVAVPLLVIGGVWLFTVTATSIYYPPLQVIFDRFVKVWVPRAWSDVVPSVTRMMLGLILAFVAGIVLGMLLGQSRYVRALLHPALEFLRAIPAPALIPFFMLLFGVGDVSKVYLIAFVCLWPILLNTIDGVAGLDPTLHETAQVYQIPWFRRQVKVVLAAAAPQVMAGIRTALALALIMVVVSEMVASTNGIGYLILQSQRTFAIPEMWAGIILLGIFGYAFNLVFSLIQVRLLAWHSGAMANKD